IAEWFPIRERAFAMGIFNSGVAIGNIVAFPLVTWLQMHFGWKAAFLVTGGLGFIWLIAWRLAYDTPDRHPALGAEERRLIESGRVSDGGLPRRSAQREGGWGALLAY